MADRLRPRDSDDLREAVAWAVASEQPLEVVAGGSKRALGRPAQNAATLDLGALAGIVAYEPSELVVTARAATPLDEIETALAADGQMLAFEPPVIGPLLGPDGQVGDATLGGVLACNLAGPRRVKAGAARDHFLGTQAVSGRGEHFKTGGRVVKNVSGYDLCKLLAGSYGTLAVMHEVTLKVLPLPERTRTVLVFGLDDAGAVAALGSAMSSAHEVSGAAHLPAALAARSEVSYVAGAGQAVTALRVEGFARSVEARCAALRALLAEHGALEELHSRNSAAFWRELRDVRPLAGTDAVIWRLSVPPAAGAAVVARIETEAQTAVRAVFDWAGGLIWLAVDAVAPDGAEPAVRGAVAETGGHATLFRAPAQLRATRAVFSPQEAAAAALTARLKTAFDPAGVLNPGRMYAGV